MLASEVASKNSCAHVTADHEVSAKTSAEELKTLAEATQVLQSETCGADGQMYSLFQENSSVACQTSTDLKGFDMGTVVRQLTEQEHSAAHAQRGSRVSAIMKFSAGADNDLFVKVRAAWRVITSIEQKEKSKSEEQLASYAREYIAKVEDGLQKIREGVLALTDKKLIPLPSTDESKAFYYKMKSDYHRYLAEQDTEVPKTSSRDRTFQRAAEQIPNVPVPETVSRDGVQQRTVEQIVDAPVPQAVKELAEVSKVFSQDRVQQCFGKQTIETPAISLAERVVEAPDTQTQDKTQHVVNTHVQHVVNTVEVERPKLAKETVQEKINQVTKHTKIPQVQFLNKVDDMLVDVQQQIRPMAQTQLQIP